jgi:phosphate transport system substrate-binding protein
MEGLMGFRLLGIVAAALAGLLAIQPAVAEDDDRISGAGSTFAYPVISEWVRAYQRSLFESEYALGESGLDTPATGKALDYEPVGSLAGMMRVMDGRVDFAASDVPLNPDELARLGLGQFPLVMGGVVAAVNIEGVAAGQMKFTGPLLADIFLGTIQKWNDPAIQALNPDVKLPDARIIAVYRSDGSGTTYNFAHYLARVSPAWATAMGVDTLLPWKAGTSAKGNDGVAAMIKQTANSIGYVEYVQAMRAGLAFALIRNRAGKFVKPEPASFQAAAATAGWPGAKDFHLMLTDAPGEASYPIAATVFVLMRKEASWLQDPRAALNFFRWSLDQGASKAAELGYVPLPAALVGQVKDYWAKTFKAGV